MANMCSRHHPDELPHEGCVACHTTPEMLFPNWQEKCLEAEAAGIHKCVKCEFEYYKVTDICPLCSHPRESTTTTIGGSWLTAAKNWLDSIAS